MPTPLTHSLSLPRWLLLIMVVIGLKIPGSLQAQALTCPDYSSSLAKERSSHQPSTLAETAKLPIKLQADGWDATVNGAINLNGNVQAHQGERSLSADALHYDMGSKDIVASGTVHYEDSTLQLSGNDASMNADGGAAITSAGFALKDAAGRGTAQQIQLNANGNVSLDKVRYTTCPAGRPDWELRLSDLDINQRDHVGTGRNVRLDFKGVPIFYTPWISFPVGNQRKSGFLFPSFGGSSRGGNALSAPWYWNLASNYDDTITPTYDTSRGFKLDNEFRYLGDTSKALLSTGYLPHDHRTGQWRGLVQLNYRNDFTEAVRLSINAGEVHDREWFEDFGATRDLTSTVYLTRALTVNADYENWRSELLVQNLQVVDNTLLTADRPYTVLPQLSVAGRQTLPFGGEFNLDSELGYFTRAPLDDATQTKSITGGRLYLAPTLSMPLRARGLYVTPSVGWRYTGYQLQNNPTGEHSPSLSAPVYSVDGGMVFERFSGSKQQRLYTLEPRVLYSYVPYRTQNNLPVFDTGLPDFDLVQLFQTNRFIGPDRLGDANQLSAGVTTRMLNAHDGRQFLAATLGQAFFFKTPCVTALITGPQTQAACGRSNNSTSDIIGQLSLTAYKNWTINMGVQWNPVAARNERSDLFIQYRPGPDRVINVGYRYDITPIDPTTRIKQWESSFAWPVSRNWSTYGRVVYSSLDRKLLDRFAGVEYRSCCWNIRAVVGRAITTRTGQYDTQYKLQLELKGLSSVGTADAFLSNSIPGYSARAAEGRGLNSVMNLP